ncbi:hypothetical protein D3C76_584080 [compost metagenome]
MPPAFSRLPLPHHHQASGIWHLALDAIQPCAATLPPVLPPQSLPLPLYPLPLCSRLALYALLLRALSLPSATLHSRSCGLSHSSFHDTIAAYLAKVI